MRTPAKRQTKVDGSFLVELRESDLIDPLGMEHKLHIKKLMLAREKLMPMSEEEQKIARTVRTEQFSEQQREGVPDIDAAFSQVSFGDISLLTFLAMHPGVGVDGVQIPTATNSGNPSVEMEASTLMLL